MRSNARPTPASPARRHVLALAVAQVLPGRASATPAGPIRIGGTGVVVALSDAVRELLAAAAPDIVLRIVPSLGSAGGIAALKAGAIDIAFSLRPPTEREGARDLEWREIGRSPIAVVTNTGAPVEGLSLEELFRILAGEVTTWPTGETIRLVRRPQVETTLTLLAHAFGPRMAEALERLSQRPGIAIAATDQDNAEALEARPDSLGFMQLGQLLGERRRLRVLALDGVVPGVDALRSGAWRAAAPLFLVRPGADAGPAGQRARALSDLLTMALLSTEGRARLGALGYLLGDSRWTS